jgi:hypothetical protein
MGTERVTASTTIEAAPEAVPLDEVVHRDHWWMPWIAYYWHVVVGSPTIVGYGEKEPFMARRWAARDGCIRLPGCPRSFREQVSLRTMGAPVKPLLCALFASILRRTVPPSGYRRL